MTHEDGEGWTTEQVSTVEKWYKRFLFLNLKYPSFPIVPTKAIDVFWHYHILDTMKYADDCQKIFGRFLHHFPYFGMRGEEDKQDLDNAFVKTSELCVNDFGESTIELRDMFSSTRSIESSGCEGTECGGTACGSSNCDGGDKCNGVFETRPTVGAPS